MTDLRQAAQQALETLEGWDNYGAWVWPESALEQSKQNTTDSIATLKAALEQPEQEQMRMPKVGDKVICLEDESLGEVVSLTAGGSPDITFDDGSRGTYLLREFAELFGYVAAAQPEQEPVADGNKVICPACCHQFRAIPTAVQTLMLNAGFEPPFVTPPAAQPEPPPEWVLIKNILDEYGLQAISFVAEWKAAQRQWVGLEPEEILDLFDRNNVYGSKWIDFAGTVEAKLKAKNV